MDALARMHQNKSGKLTASRQQFCRLLRCSDDELSRAFSEISDTKTGTVEYENVRDCNAKVTLINRRMEKEFNSLILGDLRIKKYRDKQKSNAAVTPQTSDFRLQTSDLEEEKKEKKERLHPFEKSPFYEFEKWNIALADWPAKKAKYFWDRAKAYSETKGAKYLNWIKAVRNWDNRDPEQWKKGGGESSKDAEMAHELITGGKK